MTWTVGFNMKDRQNSKPEKGFFECEICPEEIHYDKGVSGFNCPECDARYKAVVMGKGYELEE